MTSMQSSVETVVIPPARDLIGGFKVRRALPTVRRRMVGPFVFLDQMGPESLDAGSGLDVPPHPHIGLATVTYLFAGELLHRDSIGSEQLIRPGDVNWMSAGRGIAHSERSTRRDEAMLLSGLQAWVALPIAHEEMEPEFAHHGAAELPRVEVEDGVTATVIAGQAFGVTAPARTLSPLFYVDVVMSSGSRFELSERYTERALYVVDGELTIDADVFASSQLVVIKPDQRVTISTSSGARVMLLGGEPFPERRHIWWNFVSSSTARIEQAKRDWKERRFPAVPGDEAEFIPLPE